MKDWNVSFWVTDHVKTTLKFYGKFNDVTQAAEEMAAKLGWNFYYEIEEVEK